MIQLSAKIYTRDKRTYEGRVVSGEFVFDGNTIPVSKITHLKLPCHTGSNGHAEPGILILSDGTKLPIPGTTNWFSQTFKYELSGHIKMQADSLATEVLISAENITDLLVLLDDSEILSTLRTRFLSSLESWIEAEFISDFEEIEVKHSGARSSTIKADLHYYGGLSPKPATKLALGRAVESFGKELAQNLDLRLVSAVIEEKYHQRIKIEMLSD